MQKFVFSRANAISPIFESKFKELLNCHFSRNSDIYPIFKSPPLSNLINFQKNCRKTEPETEDYGPGSDELQSEILNQDTIPQNFIRNSDDLNKKLLLISGLSKNWMSPISVENVGTYPSDPGVFGSIIGSITNANMVHYEYCRMSSDLENTVTKMVSNLVGYDPSRSIGLFTQGGTMCNLYGYLCGIRKSIPDSDEMGINSDGKQHRFIFSEAGHYGNKTILSVLGNGYKKNVIKIEINEKNSMNINEFSKALENCFRNGIIVPTIVLTLGSTDTFANDDIKKIVTIRDELCKKYNVSIKPHIHADSAVGWAILFFSNYDFTENNLGINEATLGGLKKLVDNFKNIYMADSMAIDFHKWGYVPYSSSMILFKEKNDFYKLMFESELFKYFQECDPTDKFKCTLECSRSAVGLFGAYSILNGLGVDGMRLLVANGIQNASYLREISKHNPHMQLVASGNEGPNVGYKLYPGDPKVEFEYETTQFPDDPAGLDKFYDRVNKNRNFHKKIHEEMGQSILSTSWIGSVGHSNYNSNGNCCYLEGEKMVFFNPLTGRDLIDKYVCQQEMLCSKYSN